MYPNRFFNRSTTYKRGHGLASIQCCSWGLGKVKCGVSALHQEPIILHGWEVSIHSLVHPVLNLETKTHLVPVVRLPTSTTHSKCESITRNIEELVCSPSAIQISATMMPQPGIHFYAILRCTDAPVSWHGKVELRDFGRRNVVLGIKLKTQRRGAVYLGGQATSQ